MLICCLLFFCLIIFRAQFKFGCFFSPLCISGYNVGCGEIITKFINSRQQRRADEEADEWYW